MTRRKLLAARAVGWILGLVICSVSGLDVALLSRLIPVQREVYSSLMPDFEIRSFSLEVRGAQLKVRAVTRSSRYLLVRGRAHEPGNTFEAETPARPVLLYAVLIAAGLLLTNAAAGSASAIGLPALAILLVLPPPLVLAGEQWALLLGPEEGPSLPSALAFSSGIFLHGGGLALCAAVVWLTWARTQRRQRQAAGAKTAG